MNRRHLIRTCAIVATAFSSLPARATDGTIIAPEALLFLPDGFTDTVLGSATAPVTMIEYSSPTCGHCADYYRSVRPRLIEQFVTPGRVRLISRPFLRDVVDATIFLLAHAAGPDRREHVLAAYYEHQSTWLAAPDRRLAIQNIALQLGFTPASFEAALANEERFNVLMAVRNQAVEQFGLAGTPTFYVNGLTISGARTLDDLAAVIEAQ